MLAVALSKLANGYSLIAACFNGRGRSAVRARLGNMTASIIGCRSAASTVQESRDKYANRVDAHSLCLVRLTRMTR